MYSKRDTYEPQNLPGRWFERNEKSLKKKITQSQSRLALSPQQRMLRFMGNAGVN